MTSEQQKHGIYRFKADRDRLMSPTRHNPSQTRLPHRRASVDTHPLVSRFEVLV